MRPTLLVCALIACSSDPEVRITSLSTLPAPTDGVALWPDGETAEVGMAEQVCTVDLTGGAVLGDVDPSDGPETLLDSDGVRSLVRANGQLIELDSAEVLASGVLDARLTEEGVVALLAHEGRCAIRNGMEVVAVPKTDCSAGAGLAVDRIGGGAWIADGRSLSFVDVDGHFARRDGVAAERVAWDPASGAVIVVEGQRVSRLESDGSRAWSLDARGAVHDLDIASRAGIVAVMRADGEGATLDLVDVDSGEVAGSHPLPESAEVTLSDAGDRLALATDDQVLFYEVSDDGRALRLPDAGPGPGAWSGLGVAGVVAGYGLTVVVD